MKFLAYETKWGNIEVISGALSVLEAIVEDCAANWVDWNWFGAFGNTEKTVKQVYESKRWYSKMVEQYGANEDNWPEEE
jgi:hypothetical protein